MSTENKATENNAVENKAVLSGMRPTGRLHLGHYSVLENWAALQEFQHILQQLATMYPVENGLQAEEGALEVSFHGI